MTAVKPIRLWAASILAVLSSAILSGQGVKAPSLPEPNVVVTLGQPNAWTMEQAHYLLERNRAHDLGIAALDLGPLDANEVVGYRLEAIKSLLSATAQYDATIGKKNAASSSQYSTDVARYNQLSAKRDGLLDQQASLAAQLARSQYQLSVLQAQPVPDQTQVKVQQAEVTKLTSDKAAIDSQISSLTSTIGPEPTLSLNSSVPTADLTTATAIGQNSTFATMMQNVPPGLNNSKLQASIRLDNYINLQYEIVAKQLTLLRDQAAPGTRVIFLELPQSIYLTHKFKPYPDLAAFWGSHLVQTWWTVEQLLLAERSGPAEEAKKLSLTRPPTLSELPSLIENLRASQQDKNPNSIALEMFAGPPAASRGTSVPLPQEAGANVKEWMKSWQFRVVKSTTALPLVKNTFSDDRIASGVEMQARPAYALDLIPRRSALNVAEAQSVSRARGFAGLFGLLSGFGARARYEQQKDEYSQFAQQEAYGSAFGKGEEVFGWTFGPLPGTKRLDPGLRTTYAVMVVPASTRYIRLTGIGCGFRRRTVPKNPFVVENTGEECGDRVSYDVEVPREEDDFMVTNAFYRPEPAGRRTTVELAGRFGTQVGVLVNGTPLQRVVAIGQPMLEQTAFNISANAGDPTIQGVFEEVEQKQLILSFVMPQTFIGTPRISIITPLREAVINGYRLMVKDGITEAHEGTLEGAASMFIQSPAISRIAPLYTASDGSVLSQVFGQGFDDTPNDQSLIVNGNRLTWVTGPTLANGQYRVINAGVIQFRASRADLFPHWQIDLLDHGHFETLDASATFDDDGPPSLEPLPARCRVAVTPMKGGTVSLDIDINGHFFQPSLVPTSDKNITITSTSLTSSSRWSVTATARDQSVWKKAVVQLRGSRAQDTVMVRLGECPTHK